MLVLEYRTVFREASLVGNNTSGQSHQSGDDCQNDRGAVNAEYFHRLQWALSAEVCDNY